MIRDCHQNRIFPVSFQFLIEQLPFRISGFEPVNRIQPIKTVQTTSDEEDPSFAIL
jgi:hypothetical protein